jgi:hypothetical protein
LKKIEKNIIMKRVLSSFVLLFVFSFIYAQTIPAEQQLIRMSGFAVHSAHKAVLSSGVYTGDLAKCIEHQRYAVIQYKEGNTTEAIYHSAHARTLAISVTEANNGRVNPNLSFSQEEQQMISGSPSPAELDKKLTGKELKDENYLDPQLTGVDL